MEKDVEAQGSSVNETNTGGGIFFQKVEIQVPRIFIRICDTTYRFIYGLLQVLGGDHELMELRTLLLFWDVLSFLFKMCIGLLLHLHNSTRGIELLTDEEVLSSIDKMTALVSEKATIHEGRTQVFLSILKILRQDHSQDKFAFVDLMVAEGLWVFFFPYLLKATFIPILRRLMADRRVQ